MTRRPGSGRAVRRVPAGDRAELAARVRARYEACGSLRETAAAMLVSFGTCRRLVLEAGGTLKRPGRAPKATPAADA